MKHIDVGATVLVTGGRLLRLLEESRRAVRCLARRAPGPASLSTFSYRSIIDAPVTEVFRWHEQPQALAALTPTALVRIEQQEGGIRDGGRVTVSIGLGRARVRWAMRHQGYIPGRRFCDEQVHGPFVVWRHAHLFEPIGALHTSYEDRIEFAVTRCGVLNRLAAAVLRPMLTLAFAHRHRIVRTSIGRARRGVARQCIPGAMNVERLLPTPQTGASE